MKAWLQHADPESKLIPRNLYNDDGSNDIWNAKDSAADNYPFMVLTSFFTDQKRFHGVMREMLENEIKLTSRIESLPDTYSFSKRDFKCEDVSMDRIVFGASEYIKDGLLPLTEWLGRSPWSERMITMLTDLNIYIDVAGLSENSNFDETEMAEVNGELLQTLSRVYWMTGRQEFLDWAIQIGDYFLLGEGYPLAHFKYLTLRDHGNELISGLAELYATLSFTIAEKKNAYREPLYKLLDSILEFGRNSDGLFFNAINPQTGEILDHSLSDGWGYMLNGYYTVYLIDRVNRYKEAVIKSFGNLHRYHKYNWEDGSADGYADAIEGAINLVNRIPDSRVAEWIDSEIQVMWAMQDSSHLESALRWKNSGIIEGWHGDGNFARTSLMYSLWKTKGTYIQPWKSSVRWGAETKGDTLYLAIKSEDFWEGKLYFDKARHKLALNMPLDWTRINQYPEWFTAHPSERYQLKTLKKEESEEVKGISLIKGIPVTLKPDEIKWFMVIPK